MLIRGLVPILAAVLMLLALGACSEGGEQQMKEETGEAAQATEDYASEQYAKFRENLEQNLEELEQDIQRLDEKAEEMSGEARRDIENRLDNLKDEKAAVREKLQEWNQQGDDAWEEFKQDLGRAMDKLEKSYQRLVAEIQESLN
jgi:prefoldin subunit 5